MRRYFFHRKNNVFLDTDHEGTELASFDDARKEALRYAAQSILDDPEAVWSGEFRMDVADEVGAILFTVVVTTESGQQPTSESRPGGSWQP